MLNSLFKRTTTAILNSFDIQNHAYLIHTWSDKALKGTVVNIAFLSLHRGALEMRLQSL